VMTVAIAGVVIVVTMLLETRLSVAHERVLRREGAREPADDVYPLMRAVYPSAFACMLAEGFWRQPAIDAAVVAGTVIFIAAKAIKYWAMATLGSRWTFRVLVPPQSSRILAGPYRWIRHPNYVGVAGELLGAAIGLHAIYTGPIFVVAFTIILLARIRVEERALGLRTE
jgi:methyltransferase